MVVSKFGVTTVDQGSEQRLCFLKALKRSAHERKETTTGANSAATLTLLSVPAVTSLALLCQALPQAFALTFSSLRAPEQHRCAKHEHPFEKCKGENRLSLLEPVRRSRFGGTVRADFQSWCTGSVN